MSEVERIWDLVDEIANYFMKDYEPYDPEEMLIDAQCESLGLEGYENLIVEDLMEMSITEVTTIHRMFFQINK